MLITKICLLYMICIVSIKSSIGFDPNAVSHISKSKLLSTIEKGDEKLLIFFYTKFEDCPQCKEDMPLFQEAAGYLDQLEDDQIKSYKLAVKLPEYGVNTFPQLVFFDGKTPFKYDKSKYEPDDIVDWIEESKETPTADLNDETFEHLTQASSGSTTGDWLILFANSKRPECMKQILPDMMTVASRLRRRKNIATLCTKSNPVTSKRFGLDPDTHCAKILFIKKTEVPMKHARGSLTSYSFHRTDLYTYEKESTRAEDLLKFVMKDFNDQEPQIVPKPYDAGNAELKSSIHELSDILMHHVRSSTVMFVTCMVVAVVIIAVTFQLILSRIRTKKLA